MLVVFGALAGAKALNELVVETCGAGGPAILHITGRRDYELVRRRVAARRLPRARRDRPVRRGARRSTWCSRARAAVWEIAAAGSAGDPRPVSVRDRRPPGEERRALRRGGRRDHGARARPRRRAGPRALAARRPAAARDDGRGDAARGDARTRRTRSRRSWSRLRALDGRRLWFVGIGGAGLSRVRAARARLGRRGRRLGPRRDAVPRAARAACRSRSRPSRSCRTAGRSSSRRRTPACPALRRAEFLARARRGCGRRSSSPGRTARGRRRR